MSISVLRNVIRAGVLKDKQHIQLRPDFSS